MRRRFNPACAGNTTTFLGRPRRLPVQPRVRGEHVVGHQHQAVERGSTPRARGTPQRVRQPVPVRRFNPACAGNTTFTMFLVGSMSVQPRVRGEHRGKRVGNDCHGGSTPRARGTHHSGLPVHHPVRFNPACAGNTTRRTPLRRGFSVQPRVRGEHARSAWRHRWSRGSTPRARGTRETGEKGDGNIRFNPACAGNTSAATRPPPGAAVQPRVRGEHNTANPGRPNANGSTPRARGTPPPRRARGWPGRFNPACAGNTSLPPATMPKPMVQPRVRGEHCYREDCWEQFLRFNPACAGNTDIRRGHRNSYSVQPRVRGEHVANRNRSVFSVGSTPRARGTLLGQDALAESVRFNPACAGNTGVVSWNSRM